MRIRILGSLPLTNGTGCGPGVAQKHTDPSDPDPDADSEHWYIYIILLSSVADPDPHVFGPPGSGSISQRHGSADPDPPQNVRDPQHCFKEKKS
jgi:hypothetical protein